MIVVSTRSRYRTGLVPLLALVLAIGSLLPAAQPARAATTFTVTTIGDEPDRNLNDTVCDVSAATSSQCTLRAAIQEANTTPGKDTIAFAIPGGGLQTIKPGSPLPTITQRVTIDGYTQPGAAPNTATSGTNAALRIELDGSNAGAGAAGLAVATGVGLGGVEGDDSGTLIRGLVVNRFADDGIRIDQGVTAARIAGCFIGTTASGTAARPNGRVGVSTVGPNTVVGGANPAARNLIAGNDEAGVVLAFFAAASRVQGNLIGTDNTGAAPLGQHRFAGVSSSTIDALIGGTTAAEANVIAFNAGDGVQVAASVAHGTRILRNAIFANGDGAFGNRGLGIDISGDGPTPNDAGDADGGANHRQNTPVVDSAATSGGTTIVEGRFSSEPGRSYVLRFYSNPNGGDQGQVFEGQLPVTTNGAGFAPFTFAPATPIPAGQTVTATATNQATGDTSEFSAPTRV